MWAGSVQTLNTSARGASKTRVATISRSDDSGAPDAAGAEGEAPEADAPEAVEPESGFSLEAEAGAGETISDANGEG